MKVFQNINEFKDIVRAVVTIGTFDGIHIGHQKIIDTIKNVAKKNNSETVILTFSPHPRIVLQPDFDLKLIYTEKEKINILRELGIDNLIIQPFSKEISLLSTNEYIDKFIINIINPTAIVIGYDHHFGKNREGSILDLKEYATNYGFEIIEVSSQNINDVSVSSTKIRNAILEGDMKTTSLYLGRDFMITGKVVKGEKNGRKIGFPTANISVSDKNKLIPTNGVYAVRVKILDKMFEGMLNIGKRPTFNNDLHNTIEVHMLDFPNWDIYDKYITIYFIQKIRDEIKFNSLDDLKNQLINDRKKIKEILKQS